MVNFSEFTYQADCQFKKINNVLVTHSLVDWGRLKENV